MKAGQLMQSRQPAAGKGPIFDPEEESKIRNKCSEAPDEKSAFLCSGCPNKR